MAVYNLDEALKPYQGAGMSLIWRGELGSHGIKVVFVGTSKGTKVELLEPTSPDSTVGKFLARRGPGLHHIAFLVKDVDRALQQAKEMGYELVDQSSRLGAMNRKVGFIHPRSFGGVLVELVQST
ncbi:methylmalonyl-CoA epimerase [Sulfodiicoccus acidiphilus]|uniref:Methylmalonyl-CoA epimerase n=1 Tax=Sulfodiicoccus acidiphilus TaxID=1670455 RepID=A0A348B3T2_9CREN|nr:methylmalonyl-CoA epimerase [Sulfodiicoccus acidiphilus]GGT88628.1 methylmalonyl-CoA epimerase [Sulfodiicoccus acidiphilus]